MPRIKLKPLEKYGFQTEITVRVTDMNYGGHLGNDRLLSLVHEARVAFLANFGFSELNFGGVSLIMADTAIVYQREAYAGDVLIFAMAAGEPTKKGFRFFYRIIRKADRAAIALVENGMVCYNYNTGSLQSLPDVAKNIF